MAGTNANLPAGPGAPALVQSLRYYRDPYGYLRDCWKRYGDWFTVKQIPCGTIVYVAAPEAVRQLFVDPGSHLVAPINAYMEPVLGGGLFLQDGGAHARERRWVASSLTAERLSSVAAMVAELAQAEVDAWPIGKPFAVRPELERLTLRVILRVLFGPSAADRAERIVPLVLRLKSKDLVHSVLAALPFGLASWRLSREAQRTLDVIDREIFSEIAGRKQGTATDAGVLAGLLAPLSDGSVPSERSIRDQVMTLIFAGHETVSTTLSWALERLVRHPAVMGELRRTLDAGDDAYADAVLLETMRQRPTIADVGRELTSELSVDGRTVPAGARVCPAIALVHMRSELFPEPDAFRPERFAEGSRMRPWLYLPFGGGVRKCVGEALAMLEMREILRAIMQRVELRVGDAPPERGVSNGVTIAPHRGGMITIEARR